MYTHIIHIHIRRHQKICIFKMGVSQAALRRFIAPFTGMIAVYHEIIDRAIRKQVDRAS